jgi:hypothetical protein
MKLDLHGVRHHDVDILVENFVFTNQHKFPITIVCGNSMQMVKTVEKTISRIGCETSMLTYGNIVVSSLN